MSAFNILSDVAVMGAMHAMLAEARVRHLMVLINQWGLEGKSIENGTIENQLERVARSLFQCTKRWNESPFIDRAKGYLFSETVDALVSYDPNMRGFDFSEEPIMDLQAGPRAPTHAEVSAGKYLDYMTGLYDKMLAKAIVNTQNLK